MEDLPRDLAQDMRHEDHGPKPETSKSWTLLLVGDLGRIISFRFSKTCLVSVACVFVAICAFAGFATMSYFRVSQKNRSLRRDLVAVNASLAKAREAREDAQVRLMLSKGKAKARNAAPKQKKAGPQPPVVLAKEAKQAQKVRPEKKRKAQNKAGVSVQKAKPVKHETAHSTFVAAQAADSNAAAQEPHSRGVSKQEETIQPVSVVTVQKTADAVTQNGTAGSVSEPGLVVEKLEIWEEDGKRSVRFQFSLKNIGAQGEKIKGYTFVVLKPGEGSPEPPRGSPWTPLKDGRPSLFKRGQFFSIARFKYVRGTVPQIQDVSRFKTATIYVYTESGNLLVEKIFDVADILRS